MVIPSTTTPSVKGLYGVRSIPSLRKCSVFWWIDISVKVSKWTDENEDPEGLEYVKIEDLEDNVFYEKAQPKVLQQKYIDDKTSQITKRPVIKASRPSQHGGPRKPKPASTSSSTPSNTPGPSTSSIKRIFGSTSMDTESKEDSNSAHKSNKKYKVSK